MNNLVRVIRKVLAGGSLTTNLAEFLGENQKRPLFPAWFVGNKGLAKAEYLPVEPGLRQYVDSTYGKGPVSYSPLINTLLMFIFIKLPIFYKS